jgi:hypothetical protein
LPASMFRTSTWAGLGSATAAITQHPPCAIAAGRTARMTVFSGAGTRALLPDMQGASAQFYNVKGLQINAIGISHQAVVVKTK